MPERLTPLLVDQHGGPSRTAFAASGAIVTGAFIVAFLLALVSRPSEPQRPAPAGTAVGESTSPRMAARAPELRQVAALPDLQRDRRPRRPSPLPAATASRAASAPQAVSPAPEPWTPDPVDSPPEPAPAPAAPPPAPAAVPPAAPPAHAPEPREQSQPQQSFDSSGEFDSSG